MSFISPIFFVFLPSVILLYRLIPKKGRMPLILAASFLFYAYYDVRLLVLILLTILTSYFTGLFMSRTDNIHYRKCALALTFAECLGILFFFKYFNFTIESACSLLHLLNINISFTGLDIVLPMGISFYVFQNLSYSLDVYSNKTKAETNLGYYALFIVFFPQLVAGPIERPEDLLPQLKGTPTYKRSDDYQGLRFLLRGYAKKMLIADTAARFVNTAYSNIPNAGGAALLIATVLFAIQIYCDFSGYCDIALGCARFLGINLTENFNHPYQAVSIRDFWDRWHISLTRWFRDYLYIPLGGNRKGLSRQCVNVLITFLVSGLWHGANFTYIIWGGIHGTYLVMETLLLKKRAISPKWNLPRRAITFTLVCFAWIFFRAQSVSDACLVISSIFTNFMPQHLLLGLGASRTELLILLLLMLLLPFFEKLPVLKADSVPSETTSNLDSSYHHVSELTKTEINSDMRTMLLYFILIFTIILCRILILTTGGSSAFIYFEF